MTMHTTMTWEALKKARNIDALYLVVVRSTHTLVEEEQVVQLTRKVRIILWHALNITRCFLLTNGHNIRIAITDPTAESRLALLNLNIYVPRDERFSHVKFSDFLAYAVKSLGQVLVPEIASIFDKTFNEFDSFQDVLDLYEGGIKLPDGHSLEKIRECVPWEMLKELIRNDGERLLKFPMPAVIKGSLFSSPTASSFSFRNLIEGLLIVVSC